MPRTHAAETIEAKDNEVAHLIGVLRHVEVLALLADDEDQELVEAMLRIAARYKARLVARRNRTLRRNG